MFRDTLLDSSPTQRAWLSPRERQVASLAGLAAFAMGAEVFSHLPWFQDSWSWLEGGLAAAFVAVFYSLMLGFVGADCRRAGMHARQWMAVALIFNVPGLVLYLIASARMTGQWKRIALPLAYLFEVLLLGTCVIMPLISTAALPKLTLQTPVAPLALGTRARPDAAKRSRAVTRALSDRILRTPPIIPAVVSKEIEPPVGPQVGETEGLVPGVPDGLPGGGLIKLLGEPPVMAPTLTAMKPSVSQGPFSVSKGVEAAKLIYGPKPDYPTLARMARIEGTVRLKAIISRDGSVQELKVLGGHPLLVKAAVGAVESWRYSPTLLDRTPVEVETEIDVIFKLSD